jgi:hypothetical protein
MGDDRACRDSCGATCLNLDRHHDIDAGRRRQGQLLRVPRSNCMLNRLESIMSEPVSRCRLPVELVDRIFEFIVRSDP